MHLKWHPKKNEEVLIIITAVIIIQVEIEAEIALLVAPITALHIAAAIAIVGMRTARLPGIRGRLDPEIVYRGFSLRQMAQHIIMIPFCLFLNANNVVFTMNHHANVHMYFLA
jgi:hypothetical protein